jgi:hypothetical protein
MKREIEIICQHKMCYIFEYLLEKYWSSGIVCDKCRELVNCENICFCTPERFEKSPKTKELLELEPILKNLFALQKNNVICKTPDFTKSNIEVNKTIRLMLTMVEQSTCFAPPEIYKEFEGLKQVKAMLSIAVFNFVFKHAIILNENKNLKETVEKKLVEFASKEYNNKVFKRVSEKLDIDYPLYNWIEMIRQI